MHAFDLAPALDRPRLWREGLASRRPKLVPVQSLEERLEALGLSCRTNQPPRRPLDYPEGITSPRQLSGLVAWYRGDLGITPGVAGWANQITGDANTNLAQAVVANQPTYNAADAAYNGQSTLSFDGVNDTMTTGVWAATVAQPYTWFVVGNDSGGAAAEEYMEAHQGGANRSIVGGSTITPIYSIYAGAERGSGARSNAKRVIGGIVNGATSKFFINAKTAAATGNAGANGPIATLVAGSSFAATALLAGKLAEITIYNRVLTQAEIDLLLPYFGARYAIAIGP